MEAPAVIRGGLLLLARNRVLLGLIGAEICWSVGMVAFESLLPLRLEEMLGSAQAAGALMGPVAAVGWGIFALGTWLAGRLSKRWGVARAAMLGRGLNALGVVVMGLTLTPAQLVAAYLFTYTMHGLNGPPGSTVGADSVATCPQTPHSRSTVDSHASFSNSGSLSRSAPPSVAGSTSQNTQRRACLGSRSKPSSRSGLI